MTQISEIEFDYRVGWASDYERLFRNEFSETTPASRIRDYAAENGRVILTGKGGSGKTTILKRLHKQAQASGASATLINLKHWSSRLHEEWDRTQDPAMRADLLMSELGNPQISLDGLDHLPPSLSKFVLIDGLNEVRSIIAEQIIDAADRIASKILGLSVILSDRLVRRELITSRWTMASVRPLEQNTVKIALGQTIGSQGWDQATDSQRQMLVNPFFLNKAIEDGRLTASTAEAIESFLKVHATDAADLDSSAIAAFQMYAETGGSRTFPMDRFSKFAGATATDKLLLSGTLIQQDDNGFFDHHLFHDYLAARYLAKNPEAWNEHSLNVITFGASSFDSVALVLEQLKTKQADVFLRHVFDWNPYAAAYAISEVEGGEVSSEIKFVIAAMLAERLHDNILATVRRSSDALSILGTADAAAFLRLDLKETLAKVSAFESNEPWFNQWRELFTRVPGDEEQPNDLEYIQSADPILGWTAANVLRRSTIKEAQLDQIRALASNAESNAVRWRCVHVLGSFPDQKSVATLVTVLSEDQYEWARYGALRSLLEIAARSQDLTMSVFRIIEGHLELLKRNARLRDEFARAIFARQIADKSEWLLGVGRVLRSLASTSADRREFEKWITVGDELEKHATYVRSMASEAKSRELVSNA